MSRLVLSTDCRHYNGEKPCRYGRLCEGCPHFESVGNKILVIKLGAMGDVMRTTTLLPALREKYGPCHITWVVHRSGYDLLLGNPLIDRLLALELPTVLRLDVERFDAAICLDKEDGAAALIHRVYAKKKLGYGMDENGGIRPLNEEADYAFSLGVSDEIKFRQNQRSYQDFTFEAAGLFYGGEEYVFHLTDAEKDWGRNRLVELGVKPGDKLIGLNTGAGPVFATKKWTREGFVQLARMAVDELGARVLLMGGPEEVERNRAIGELLQDLGDRVIDAGTDNPLRGFAGMVGQLDLLVTGDTLAMHLAVAQKVPTIAIFGPTCAQEVDLYGRGEKVLTNPECAPCYRKECIDLGHKCMKELSPETVLEAMKRWWTK